MGVDYLVLKKQGTERVLTFLNEDDDFIQFYAEHKEIVKHLIGVSYVVGYDNGIEKALSIFDKIIKEREANDNK